MRIEVYDTARRGWVEVGMGSMIRVTGTRSGLTVDLNERKDDPGANLHLAVKPTQGQAVSVGYLGVTQSMVQMHAVLYGRETDDVRPDAASTEDRG